MLDQALISVLLMAGCLLVYEIAIRKGLRSSPTR